MPIQMHTENKQVNNLFLSIREIFSQQNIFFSFSKQQMEIYFLIQNTSIAIVSIYYRLDHV